MSLAHQSQNWLWHFWPFVTSHLSHIDSLCYLVRTYLLQITFISVSFQHLLLTFKLRRVFCVCPIIYGHQCIFVFHERNSATLAEYPNLWAHNTKWCLRIELMLEIPTLFFSIFMLGHWKIPLKIRNTYNWNIMKSYCVL